MKQELQNCQNEDSVRLIRSFGRVKSRKLSDHKNYLIENLYPSYKIKDKTPFESSNNFAKKSFEIGFGFGDFIFEKAKQNPNQFFYGCEPHINGVVSLLDRLEKNPLKNIQFSFEDARIILKDFPDNFFDEFYILFADPWPKTKHFKRRLINQELLDFVAKKMRKNSKLVIATDDDSYKTWILSSILKNKNFNWLAKEKKDWKIFPDDWIKTKYQRKAENEGRESVIFILEKI